VTFANPFLLLTLLVIPVAITGYLIAERRRARYAVRYTNIDVLALVAAGGRPWRRWLTLAIFLLTVAVLCTAVARPKVNTMVASDKATIVLVLDVSGSMQAIDVKPTRLVAAQKALQTFLEKVPKRVRVGLVLFAGEAQVATPPTTDHDLVSQAVDDAGSFHGFGGTAIGDAIATAVQLGIRTTGVEGRTLASYTPVAAAPEQGPSSTLVTILFLSDGHQTQGTLTPQEGAAKAKIAGFPVYTVALGTTGATRLRGFPGGGNSGLFNPNNPNSGNFGGFGRRALSPDPKTLRAIANTTGGEFFNAKTAGSVEAAYAKLGSSLGRTPGKAEVTDSFLIGGAILLVLALGLSALWSPRLP
jgi:Ca-activated chloride channel family protein